MFITEGILPGCGKKDKDKYKMVKRHYKQTEMTPDGTLKIEVS